MAAHLGETMIVDNRPGGGGAIAVAELRRASPDGRTLALLGNSTLCILPALRRPLPFNVEADLSLVARFMTSPFGVVVPATSTWLTPADGVAAARREPGRINVGHTGVGSLGHLLIEEWAHRAGIQFNPVPFDASSLTPALLRAEVPMTIDGLGLTTPHIRAGRLRLLAVAAPQNGWRRGPTRQHCPRRAIPASTVASGGAWPARQAWPTSCSPSCTRPLSLASDEAGFKTRREELGSVIRVGSTEQIRIDVRAETSHWAAVAARLKIQLD